MATPVTIMGANCSIWSAADLALTLSGTPLLAGTSPAVTWSGTLSRTDVPLLTVHTGGTLGVATLDYSLDGGPTTAGTVTSGGSVALGVTGITIACAAGTYNASDTYAARVATFPDQAGGHDFAQVSLTNQPSLLYSVKNGVRGVKFNGTSGALSNTFAGTNPSTSPFLWWGVVRQDGWTGGGNLIGTAAGSPVFRLRQQTSTPRLGQGVVNENSGLAIATVGRIEVAFTGSTSDYVQLIGTKVTGARADAGQTLSNIALGTGTAFSAVTILEFAHFNVIPSRAQLDALNLYAGNKYGFDVVGTVTTKAFSFSSSASVSIAEQVRLNQAYTGSTAFNLTRAAAFVRSFASTANLSVSKQAQKSTSFSATSNLAIAKQVQLPRSLASIAAVSVQRNVGVSRSLGLTASLTVSRSLSVARSFTSTASLSVARALGLSLGFSVAAVFSFIAVAKHFVFATRMRSRVFDRTDATRTSKVFDRTDATRTSKVFDRT